MKGLRSALMSKSISFSIKFPKYIVVPGFIAHLVMGYVWGMLFSEHIFADFTQTHWNNAWVYIWLVFWPLALTYFFFLYIGGFCICVGLLYLAYDKFLSRHVLNWRHRSMRNKVLRNHRMR